MEQHLFKIELFSNNIPSVNVFVIIIIIILFF